MQEKPNGPDGAADGDNAAAPAAAPARSPHLLGEPDTLPPTWCRKCEAEVKPIGKGNCPRCGRVLKGSFLARRHPVNKLRRQQILEKLVSEHRPQTTMAFANCSHLAGILEQLEVLKPGSTEHQRLVQLSQTLADALDARSPANSPGVETMPSAALEMAADLLRRQQAGEQLSDRELGQLDILRAAVDGRVALPADPPDAPPTPNPTLTEARFEPGDPRHVEEIPHEAPHTEPARCQYCGQAPCVGAGHHAYEVLHYNDPTEVARRDGAATAVMLHQLRTHR
jgi:hypothetical protein